VYRQDVGSPGSLIRFAHVAAHDGSDVMNKPVVTLLLAQQTSFEPNELSKN